MCDVEDYISVFSNPTSNNAVQMKKIAAIKGKLYKYYSFQSDYTFSNIENEVLFFSRPDSFNDPFDCNWGSNENEFVSDLLVAAIITSQVIDFSEESEILYRIVHGISLTDTEVSVINDFFIKHFCTNIDLQKLLKCNLNDKARMLLPYLTSIDDSNIDVFFESCSKLLMYQKKLNQAINEAYGITCFSEHYDNALMWSHYADRHTGICVEYDFNKLALADPILVQLFPVIYSNTRENLPTGVSYDTNGHFLISQNPFTAYQIIKNLITKSDIWKYEQEWRLIGFVDELNTQTIQLPIISTIYLGVNISEENTKRIIEIAKRKEFSVNQMRLSNSKYELFTERIF